MKQFSRMYGRAIVATLAVAAMVGLAAAGLTSIIPGLQPAAQAATQNFSPAVPVYAMPIHISGAYTATATPLKFTMPFAARLVGFSAAARSVSGTMTIDLQVSGSSVLSAPITASTSVVEATVATAAVADEATVTAVFTISGTNPTFSDITLLPVFVR